MVGIKSFTLYSSGLFRTNPTELFAVCSVSNIIALLKELSFNIPGSATNNLPFLGGILNIIFVSI
jgi:hypothetical protein